MSAPRNLTVVCSSAPATGHALDTSEGFRCALADVLTVAVAASICPVLGADVVAFTAGEFRQPAPATLSRQRASRGARSTSVHSECSSSSSSSTDLLNVNIHVVVGTNLKYHDAKSTVERARYRANGSHYRRLIKSCTLWR